jgi:hypothetical protein
MEQFALRETEMSGMLSNSPRLLRAVRCGRALLLIAALFVSAAGPMRSQAQTQRWANEYELKSAFVYRLLSFVEWRWKSADEHLIVGFAGDGPLGVALERFLSGKSIGSHPIQVSLLRRGADLRDCNVLVIGYRDASSNREALAQVKSSGVLTVGDGEGFARQGGVVAFVLTGSNVQLAINPHAADRSSIKLSSKLLNVATLVNDEELP